MSELPKGWVTCQLGHLIDHIQAGKNVKCEERPPQDDEVGLVKISAVTWGKFNQEESKTLLESKENPEEKNRIKVGDLLISRANTLELVGAPVIVHAISKNLFLSDKVLRLDMDESLRPWVLTCLRSQAGRKQIEASATGNQLSMRNISQDAIRLLEFPLPPLAEQARIAQALDGLLAQVDTLKARLDALPALIKRFRQSVLSAAVSGQLTAEWRVRNPEQRAELTIKALKAARSTEEQEHAPKSWEELPSTPEIWGWASLGFLASPDEALCYGVIQPGPDDPDGIYLIRAGDLNSGTIDTAQLRKIPLKTHNEYQRSQVKGGEILITVVGAGIGEAAIIPPKCAGFNIARAIAKIPIREISAKYVYLWLTTSWALRWMKGSSREVARPTLNLEQLKGLPVPVPAYGEQNEIVRRVEQLFAFADQLEARLADARARVDALTQSILAKAFRGELVPQDPADEPASVLLERIKAQRAAAPKPKRGRKSV